MTHVASVIDTLFDAVIDITMRVINLYYREGLTSRVAPPATDAEAEAERNLESGEEATLPSTFKTMESLLKRTVPPEPIAAKNTIMYAKESPTPVYRNATAEFDSEIGVVPYGEMVMMLEPRGRFCRIIWNTLEGWVLKESLADRAAYVYPDFVIGEENGIDHTNTARVRAILGDPFGTKHTNLPLQPGEYVLFRLWKKGKRIAWPSLTHEPRVPGLWHKILRGASGIHINVVPRSGAIMEFMLDSEIGHLAFVEAVYPDDTITISEVNYPDSGIYNERVLTKEEWRELRPTFITVQ